MLSLSSICNINYSVCFQCKKSVSDTRQICCVIIVTTVRLNNNQGVLIFFDKYTFSLFFWLVVSGLLLSWLFFNWLLFLLLFQLFFFCFFIVLLYFSPFFCNRRILLDHSKFGYLFNHSRNKRIVVTLSELIQINVQSLVNMSEILSGELTNHFPNFNTFLIICLEFNDSQLR